MNHYINQQAPTSQGGKQVSNSPKLYLPSGKHVMVGYDDLPNHIIPYLDNERFLGQVAADAIKSGNATPVGNPLLIKSGKTIAYYQILAESHVNMYANIEKETLLADGFTCGDADPQNLEARLSKIFRPSKKDYSMVERGMGKTYDTQFGYSINGQAIDKSVFGANQIIAHYSGVNRALLSDGERLLNIFYASLGAAGIKPLGETHFKFEPEGYTGIVAFDEGHIAFHTYPKSSEQEDDNTSNIIMIDIFSQKNYDTQASLTEGHDLARVERAQRSLLNPYGFDSTRFSRLDPRYAPVHILPLDIKVQKDNYCRV